MSARGGADPIDQPQTTTQSHTALEACESLSLWALSVQKGGCVIGAIWLWRRDRPVMMSFSAQNLWEFKSFRGEFEPLISVQFPQTVLN